MPCSLLRSCGLPGALAGIRNLPVACVHYAVRQHTVYTLYGLKAFTRPASFCSKYTSRIDPSWQQTLEFMTYTLCYVDAGWYAKGRESPPRGTPMRVIAYCRVSTTDQAENGISLEAQQGRMQAYAALYGLMIVEMIVDTESAKSLHRPGLQRALALLRAGEAEGLLIVRLDRLTRSIADWQDLIDAYFGERGGKQLLSVNDSIDTRTAAGRLVLNIITSISQWEREIVSERTREALRHKISRGERCGRIRFGFNLADDGVSLVENPGEQQALTLMRDLRAAGRTLREIAAELTRRNIPTKGGKVLWKHQTVAQILGRAA